MADLKQLPDGEHSGINGNSVNQDNSNLEYDRLKKQELYDSLQEDENDNDNEDNDNYPHILSEEEKVIIKKYPFLEHMFSDRFHYSEENSGVGIITDIDSIKAISDDIEIAHMLNNVGINKSYEWSGGGYNDCTKYIGVYTKDDSNKVSIIEYDMAQDHTTARNHDPENISDAPTIGEQLISGNMPAYIVKVNDDRPDVSDANEPTFEVKIFDLSQFNFNQYYSDKKELAKESLENPGETDKDLYYCGNALLEKYPFLNEVLKDLDLNMSSFNKLKWENGIDKVFDEKGSDKSYEWSGGGYNDYTKYIGVYNQGNQGEIVAKEYESDQSHGFADNHQPDIDFDAPTIGEKIGNENRPDYIIKVQKLDTDNNGRGQLKMYLTIYEA